MSKDKTMMLVALGLGAFLLMQKTASGQTMGTAASRYFARTNGSASAVPTQRFQGPSDQTYAALGGLFGKLLGSAASQPSAPFQPLATYTDNAIAALDPNVYAQAGVDIGNPYQVYGADSIPVNPAPQFGSVFDFVTGG